MIDQPDPRGFEMNQSSSPSGGHHGFHGPELNRAPKITLQVECFTDQIQGGLAAFPKFS